MQCSYMSADQSEQLLYNKYFILSFYMLNISTTAQIKKPLLLSSYLVLASLS